MPLSAEQFLAAEAAQGLIDIGLPGLHDREEELPVWGPRKAGQRLQLILR